MFGFLFFSVCVCLLATQSCPTLCNPMNYSLPGSSVHGILQAKILECVAISFFRGSYRPRDQTHISCTGRWTLYHLSPMVAASKPAPLANSALPVFHSSEALPASLLPTEDRWAPMMFGEIRPLLQAC